MYISLVLLFTAAVSAVDGLKKCRYRCGADYKPICGHDLRQNYHTFCNPQAMEKCNTISGNNFTMIANGPCYHSSRNWRPHEPSNGEDNTNAAQDDVSTANNFMSISAD